MGKSNIIKQGWIENVGDLMSLDIIDWNRLMNYWDNTQEAAECINSWLVGHTHYAIFKYDLTAAPERSDWPGWKHIGHHPEMGRLYWNWFHKNFKGELSFSDSPDFRGKFYFDNKEEPTPFYGDVGKVSPPTFMRTIMMMDAHDAWISIVDDQTQIMLEPENSIFAMVNDHWSEMFSPKKKEIQIAKQLEITQHQLF